MKGEWRLKPATELGWTAWMWVTEEREECVMWVLTENVQGSRWIGRWLKRFAREQHPVQWWFLDLLHGGL